MTAARPPVPIRARRERPASHAVYGLYAISPFLLGVPAIAGVALAYARRDEADPLSREHFEHQIDTFWSQLAWLAAAGVWGVTALVTGGAAIGSETSGMGETATFSLLALGALIASPLHLLGSTVFGWTRLASDSPVRHDGRA